MARPAAVAAVLATTLAAALAVVACSRGGEPGRSGVTGTITVFAAASLADVFEQIAEDFEAAHPGSTVEFSFDASSTLAQQINAGAPADAFAAANESTMATVDTESSPIIFATNELVIAVEKGNPKDIRSLQDLARPGVTVVLCAEEVPCGSAATSVLAAANLSITPVSFETNVRNALGKVGDADAALVYRTDAARSPDVDAVEFPESASGINRYPIATLKDAPNPAGAAAFVAYALSPAGRAVLDAAGFGQP